MKFPVGIQTFEKIRREGYAYVDKTGLVYKLANNGQVYFLSRPRRFGKSLLVSTLEAYFSGRRDLFEGLAMERLETEWAQHTVLHLDLGGINYAEPGALEAKLQKCVADWEGEFGLTPATDNTPMRFGDVIKAAQRICGRGAVVLIDEYDKPLLDVLGLPMRVCVGGMEMTLEERNRDLLKGFYSVIKEQGRNLRFVLLTGVTKFSQVSVFSGLNSLNDISMDARYEALCGITPSELEEVFGAEMDEMAAEKGWTPEGLRNKIRRRYDGYHFSRRMTDIYNPFSLIKALDSRVIGDHWFMTGTPTDLVRLLRGSGAHLDEMVGRYYSVEEFEDYSADVERPLPMIFQSGYLTIKDYDEEMETYMLDFPNDEVRRGFLPLVADNFLGVGDKTAPAVMQMGRSLSGVVEFKLDGTADEALRQIAERGYARPYDGGALRVHRVGVSFSSETGTIGEWREA